MRVREGGYIGLEGEGDEERGENVVEDEER